VVPGSSLSPPASVVNSGSLDSMLELTAKTAVLANEPGKRRLRLRGAAIDHDFAAPAQPKVGPGTRKIREIPASADVAQLVEHFTRNVGARRYVRPVERGNRRVYWGFGLLLSGHS
jgi:hypothetical protein